MCFWFVFSQEEEGEVREKRMGGVGSSRGPMWQGNPLAVGGGDSE